MLPRQPAVPSRSTIRAEPRRIVTLDVPSKIEEGRSAGSGSVAWKKLVRNNICLLEATADVPHLLWNSKENIDAAAVTRL
jgi:hypothetical protein